MYREVVLGERPPEHLTLNDAFVRFYEEVAKGTSYGEQAQKHQLQTVLEILGARRSLADLTDDVVNGLVQALRQRRIIPWNAPLDAPSRLEPRLLSPATVNRHVATLSSVCRRARDVWKVEVGDWKLATHKLGEPEGREVFLEQDEARAFIEAIIAHARPIIFTDLATGLRKANVHELSWEQVSLDMQRAVLIQKGGRPHGVTLPGWCCDMLAALQPDPSKRTGPVFVFGNPTLGCECSACRSPAKRGKAIGSIRRAFGTAAAAIGRPELRFHDLRHTFASWVLGMGGGDMKLLQGALGHRDITTTARYSHLVAGRSEQVIGAATAGLLAPPTIEGKKKA